VDDGCTVNNFIASVRQLHRVFIGQIASNGGGVC